MMMMMMRWKRIYRLELLRLGARLRLRRGRGLGRRWQRFGILCGGPGLGGGGFSFFLGGRRRRRARSVEREERRGGGGVKGGEKLP